MGTTTPWGLRYPDPSDPPLGGSQLTALAADIDTQLQQARRFPDVPWVRADLLPGTSIPTNTLVQGTHNIVVQSYHNAITPADGNQSLRTSWPGIWEVTGVVRCSTPSAGIGAATGRLEVQLEIPSGNVFWSFTTPSLGTTPNDVFVTAFFSWPANAALRMRFNNVSGVAQSFSTPRMHYSFVRWEGP